MLSNVYDSYEVFSLPTELNVPEARYQPKRSTKIKSKVRAKQRRKKGKRK